MGKLNDKKCGWKEIPLVLVKEHQTHYRSATCVIVLEWLSDILQPCMLHTCSLSKDHAKSSSSVPCGMAEVAMEESSLKERGRLANASLGV